LGWLHYILLFDYWIYLDENLKGMHAGLDTPRTRAAPDGSKLGLEWSNGSTVAKTATRPSTPRAISGISLCYRSGTMLLCTNHAHWACCRQPATRPQTRRAGPGFPPEQHTSAGLARKLPGPAAPLSLDHVVIGRATPTHPYRTLNPSWQVGTGLLC
jgi:hypothetical protein